MEVKNEQTSFKIELKFYDEDNEPMTPDSASYSIKDDDSGTFIVKNSDFTPSTPTHLLVIIDTHNQILNRDNDEEKRIIYVEYTKGTTKGNKEIEYLCKKLQARPGE